MTDASVHAKRPFQRGLLQEADSTRGGEEAERHEWQAVSKQTGEKPGTATYKLEAPSPTTTPSHCALMPLNHPLLTRGPCQAGTVAGTAFVGMVIGNCWRKRSSAEPGPKRAAAHRAPGTYYPVWHCMTLWVCVVRASASEGAIQVSFLMYFKTRVYFDIFLFLGLFLLSDLKTQLVKG